MTRMGIAYQNKVAIPGPTSFSSTGITTTVPGFSGTNLLYEDPWLLLKTASVSGTVTVALTFASAQTVSVYGIINHNLRSAGYTSVTFEHWTGTAWTADISGVSMSSDTDVLVPNNSNISATQFRFNLGTASGNFFVGSFFLGIIVQMSRNPDAAGVLQTRAAPMLIEESAGGARHIIKGAPKRTGRMELTWQRAIPIDIETVKQMDEYSLVGIISPEQADTMTQPVGHEVFYGYVTSNTTSPRGPGSTLTGTASARYDWTLELEGAV